MKLNLQSFLVSTLALLAANTASAAIEHETCDIVANWMVGLPQIGRDIKSDWSRDGTIEAKFEEWGYYSKPAADAKQLPDGALYTNMVSSQGAKRGHGGENLWFTYTIIKVMKRDSQAPSGFVTLGESRSNPNGRYILEDSDRSLYRSVNEAIAGLPRCRRPRG